MTDAQLQLFAVASLAGKTLTGEPITVQVHVLPLRRLPELLEEGGSAINRTKLYTGLTEADVELLDGETLNAVLEAGDKANFTRLQAILDSVARLNKLFPEPAPVTPGKGGSTSAPKSQP